MTKPQPKHTRALAISPSSRGFGFAVLEEQTKLVDWGVKIVAGDKNAQCCAKVEALIAYFQPTMIVLQDDCSKGSRRSDRIQTLQKQLLELASRRKVKVKLITQAKVRRIFFAEEKGTKHGIAEILAKRFPDELGTRLPPKRRAWTSEDSRMDIFEAVALVMSSCLLK